MEGALVLPGAMGPPGSVGVGTGGVADIAVADSSSLVSEHPVVDGE